MGDPDHTEVIEVEEEDINLKILLQFFNFT